MQLPEASEPVLELSAETAPPAGLASAADGVVTFCFQRGLGSGSWLGAASQSAGPEEPERCANELVLMIRVLALSWVVDLATVVLVLGLWGRWIARRNCLYLSRGGKV